MFTLKAGFRPGSGEDLKANRVQLSKSWPTRCRFWIDFPRTETARSRLNHRSLQSPSMRTTTPSMSLEARRRVEQSHSRAVPREGAYVKSIPKSITRFRHWPTKRVDTPTHAGHNEVVGLALGRDCF